MAEPRIAALLTPMQIAVQSKGQRPGAAIENTIKKLQEENKRLKAKQTAGIVKTAGKMKPNSVRLPRELHGMVPVIDGKRVCFKYNLSKGCRDQNCTRGVHRCMVPGCGTSKHGTHNHE